MQAAIRLAACVVMVGTSAAVLADGDEATAGKPGQEQVTGATTANDDEGVGHGSGEPGRSASQIKADEGAANEAAMRDYNNKAFLAQVWTGP